MILEQLVNVLCLSCFPQCRFAGGYGDSSSVLKKLIWHHCHATSTAESACSFHRIAKGWEEVVNQIMHWLFLHVTVEITSFRLHHCQLYAIVYVLYLALALALAHRNSIIDSDVI